MFGGALLLETVGVGEPGNPPDDTGHGSVEYEYQIGKYEVTNAHWAAFLNAKAASDEHGLYNQFQSSTIRRQGKPRSYTYEVEEGCATLPVNNVTLFGALRFANWLSNGGMAGDTESGAYELNEQTIASNSAVRVPDWKDKPGLVLLPTTDEWYKAAYYDTGSDTYWNFPFVAAETPISELPPGGPASANCGEVSADETHPNGRPLAVGSYPEATGPNGTFDQGGNVWEWIECVIDGENRSARGGSYANPGGNTSKKISLPISPQAASPSIGFRVMSLKPIGEIQP